jgi:hypothetical protein
MWTAGLAYPNAAHVRDHEVLVERYSHGWCGQVSYVLLQLALAADIPARHVGLGGHVVMEAWYDDEWHAYDPDLEVIPRGPDGTVLSIEDLARDPNRLAEYYPREKSADVTEIISTRVDNTYASYPPGARFVWTADVLAQVETIGELLDVPLPVMVFVWCVFPWLRRRGRGPS